MMRAFAGTTLFVMIAWFGAGDAAGQNGPVRNRIACDALVGFAVPAASIGLPTSRATVAAAELIPASAKTLYRAALHRECDLPDVRVSDVPAIPGKGRSKSAASYACTRAK